uniref:Reverse transcriptase domain-containing protein n=1 Tax=Strongyloides venezuelensis TaxID=75913 RepID=A0A0K0F362_STRVS
MKTLPSIKEILKHGRFSYMSCIDIKNAYKQFNLKEDDRWITTISTPIGYLQSTRPAFGISFIPSIFNNVMQSLLGHVQGLYIYFDDLLFLHNNPDDHSSAILETLSVLFEKHIKVNTSKCSFFANELKFLGYALSNNGTVKMLTERKNQIIIEPISNKELLSMLSSINYSRLVIPELAKLAAPLYPKKNEIFTWPVEKQERLEKIREIVVNSQTLHILDWKVDQLSIYVEAGVDYFKYYIFWSIGENERKLLYCFSKKLRGSQVNYKVPLKWLVAVNDAAQTFYQLFQMIPVVVYTSDKFFNKLMNDEKSTEFGYAKNTFQRLVVPLIPLNIHWEMDPSLNHSGLKKRAVQDTVKLVQEITKEDSFDIDANEIRDGYSSDPMTQLIKDNTKVNSLWY